MSSLYKSWSRLTDPNKIHSRYFPSYVFYNFVVDLYLIIISNCKTGHSVNINCTFFAFFLNVFFSMIYLSTVASATMITDGIDSLTS